MSNNAARRWRRLGGRALLLLVLAAALAAPQLQGHASAQEKIIGGTPVKPGTMPFVGMVWYKKSFMIPICVGTLIAPAKVLTAASCAYDSLYGKYEPEFLSVSFMTGPGGVFDQRRIRVTGISLHPDYDPKRCVPGLGCAFDAAVLELDQTPAGINPVALVGSGRGVGVQPGARLTMAGWSGDTIVAQAPWMLTSGSATVVEPELCKGRYESLNGTFDELRVRVVPRQIICTYTVSGGPSLMELGGPSLVRAGGDWLQVGLMSAVGFSTAAKWPVVHTPLSDPETHRWLQRAAGKGGRS